MTCLTEAVACVPPGGWAVGVSGGADSVALLCLLRGRQDLSLHIVHLDHQLRGEASAEDADFVRGLAGKLGLPCTIAARDQIEPSKANLPHNPSAKYRTLRIELFRQVVMESNLQGVILAHHADDQAETILQRLIRGSGLSGLCGMSAVARIGLLVVHRPLLCVHRQQLRQYLRSIGQDCREDTSNESNK
jgi:tRNA(Ile)-lysidine synthase